MDDRNNTAFTCPGKQDCSGLQDQGLVSFDLGKVPSYLSITSSSLSCLGSALIVFAYFYLKDIRTGAQKVITLLAVADFFTASGYILGSINFLTHFNHTAEGGCNVFRVLCEIQSTITTWSSMCSYCWTCTLAFYFFLILVFNKGSLAAKLIPLYNVIAWICPMLIVLPLLLTGNLGYAPYVTSNWCFIKDTTYNKSLVTNYKAIALIFVGAKFWEIMSYFIVIILYLCIKIVLSRSKKRMRDVSHGPQLGQVEKRLLAIPLLYILLRMWGTLQFFFSLAVDHTNKDGCIPVVVQKAYLAFGILQAIGDGGQGWGNALLYIFLSPNIRRRLFGEPLDKCLLAAEEKLQDLLETETMSKSVQSRSGRVSLLASENTITGGHMASGYGVRSYRKEDTSNSTATTAPSRGTTKSAISASVVLQNQT